MTKAGVERDFEKSPYDTEVFYENADGTLSTIIFVFSSANGKARFEEQLQGNRIEIKRSLSNRFRVDFYVSDDFCDLQLYRREERRGFYIELNGEVIKWLGGLSYNGIKVIRNSFQRP